jgi:hypothetical protein
MRVEGCTQHLRIDFASWVFMLNCTLPYLVPEYCFDGREYRAVPSFHQRLLPCMQFNFDEHVHTRIHTYAVTYIHTYT